MLYLRVVAALYRRRELATGRDEEDESLQRGEEKEEEEHSVQMGEVKLCKRER
jgi:hypothetical protein